MLEARRKGFSLFCGPGVFVLTDASGRVRLIGSFKDAQAFLEVQRG